MDSKRALKREIIWEGNKKNPIEGVNVPLVIEAVMSREISGSASQMADRPVGTGQEQVKHQNIPENRHMEVENDE